MTWTDRDIELMLRANMALTSALQNLGNLPRTARDRILEACYILIVSERLL